MKPGLHQRILALILLLAPLAASAAQLEFKGIPMGVSEATVKAKFPWLVCGKMSKDDSAYGDRECNEPGYRHGFKMSEKGTFAGVSASIGFDFYANKLHRILILVLETDFDTTIQALTEKYGAPTKSETEKLQNRMGAVFTNHIYLWRLDNSTIEAKRYVLVPQSSGGTIISDISPITYSTDFAEQEYARRIRPKREKSKKDL